MLLMQKCEVCGHVDEQDSYTCPNCGSQNWLPLVKTGTPRKGKKNAPVFEREVTFELPDSGSDKDVE